MVNLNLKSIRDEVENWKSSQYNFDESCVNDVLSILDIFESPPRVVISEYVRVRSLIGYWKSVAKNRLDISKVNSDVFYSKSMKKQLGSVQERKATVSSDQDYEFSLIETSKWERVYSILEVMMYSLEPDILVQMSVNSRIEEEIDNSFKGARDGS